MIDVHKIIRGMEKVDREQLFSLSTARTSCWIEWTSGLDQRANIVFLCPPLIARQHQQWK